MARPAPLKFKGANFADGDPLVQNCNLPVLLPSAPPQQLNPTDQVPVQNFGPPAQIGWAQGPQPLVRFPPGPAPAFMSIQSAVLASLKKQINAVLRLRFPKAVSIKEIVASCKDPFDATPDPIFLFGLSWQQFLETQMKDYCDFLVEHPHCFSVRYKKELLGNEILKEKQTDVAVQCSPALQVPKSAVAQTQTCLSNPSDDRLILGLKQMLESHPEGISFESLHQCLQFGELTDSVSSVGDCLLRKPEFFDVRREEGKYSVRLVHGLRKQATESLNCSELVWKLPNKRLSTSKVMPKDVYNVLLVAGKNGITAKDLIMKVNSERTCKSKFTYNDLADILLENSSLVECRCQPDKEMFIWLSETK